MCLYHLNSHRIMLLLQILVRVKAKLFFVLNLTWLLKVYILLAHNL